MRGSVLAAVSPMSLADRATTLEAKSGQVSACGAASVAFTASDDHIVRGSVVLPHGTDIRDRDPHNMAFTWTRNSTIDNDGIACRMLQSRTRIRDLGDAHHGEIGPEIADPAGRAFDSHLIKQGVRT